MCRSVGIPAVTIDNKPHTCNLIYINGRWIEVDITSNNMYYVHREDMTKFSRSGDRRKYTGYGTLEVNDRSPEHINYRLLTYNKTKKRGTN